MAELLSDEWWEDLAARLAPLALEEPLAVGVAIERSGDPREQTVEYHVVLGPSGGRVRQGPAPEAVTLVLAEGDARRLAHGATSAQELLFEGRLRVRGDVRTLLARRDALGRLAPADSTADRPPDQERTDQGT